MKKNRNLRFIPLMLVLLLVLPMMATPVSALEATVNLRSTSKFAILAGTTVINTGSSTIIGALPEGGGNVGVQPGSAFVGKANVSMSGWNAFLSDAAGVALQAKADLVLAYDDAAGRSATTTFAEADNQLGGKTLKTGVYVLNHASTANLTAANPLTLDGEGNPDAVFIFQASSDLIMGTGSKIILINSARYCRVFWQVSSSATIKTGSQFVGHIFALTSITVETNATVNGQLLARNGAVNIHSNVITNALCTTLISTSSSPSPSSSTTNPRTGEAPVNSWPLAILLITSCAAFILAGARKFKKSKI